MATIVNKLEKVLEVIKSNKKSKSKIIIRNSLNPFSYVNPFRIKRIAVVKCGGCGKEHKNKILTLWVYSIFDNKKLDCPKCGYNDFISYRKVV